MTTLTKSQRAEIWHEMSEWFLDGGDCVVLEDAGMVILWKPHFEGCEFGMVAIAFCSYNELFDRDIGIRVALNKHRYDLATSLPVPAEWESETWARSFADLCNRSFTFSG